MRSRRAERGQATVEVLLMLPAVLLIGLALWQAHIALNAANDAENAARTAAREGGGANAAREALEPGYRDNVAKCKPGETECGIQVAGGRVTVWLDVPMIVPGGSSLGLKLKVHGSADMPGEL
jgi:hypothetical protein